MTASIIGIGTVSAAGSGIDSLDGVLRGTAEPKVEMVEVALADGPVRLPVFRAKTEGLDRFVNKRALRRLDPFVRMALLASYLAVEDAGIEFPDPERVGIAFGTGYGPLRTTFAFQDTLIDDGDKCASPTQFANSVHNALASQLSISMGLQGPCTTQTCFEWTTVSVLTTARQWLDSGLCDYVIAGVGDELASVLEYTVAMEMGTGNPAECWKPDDLTACDYRPGEAFTALVLTREDRKAPRLMEVKVRDGQADLHSLLEGATIFPALRGNHAENVHYARLLADRESWKSHAAFFGAMPTSDALEVAAAAKALRDGMIEADRIACLQCAPTGPASLILLSR